MSDHLTKDDLVAFEKRQDQRFDEFEKRQQLFISQRLESHAKATDDKIDKVLEASATAHEKIIRNQDTMIKTMLEFRDAWEEHQVKLTDHENRIDKLERTD